MININEILQIFRSLKKIKFYAQNKYAIGVAAIGNHFSESIEH